MPRTGTKFTAERRKAFVDAIREGLPISQAAARARISRQTAYEWMGRGEKTPEGQYGAFLEEVQSAMADAAAEALGHWKKAMPDDWRAAMEFLSRRFPDEYGKRERHEISGPEGEPIKVEVVWPTIAP